MTPIQPLPDMPREPLVFIVIVNWNGKSITLECLRSLSVVSYRNTRTIVVDNGSTDGSVEAIRAEFPGVVVLPMRENLRFAGGTNAGLEYALGQGADAMLLLNNDTTVGKDFLSHLVDRLLSDSSAGLVAPKICYAGEPDRIWSAGGEISMWTGTMRHRGIRETDRGQWDEGCEVDYASGCCLLARRAVVEQVGLLDTSYFMYTEDADWCLRAARQGYRTLYEPRALIWHKISVSSGGHLSWYKMKNKFIGNLRFFGRYAAWYQWPVFPWLNIVVNAAAAIRYLAQTRER